MTTPDDSPETGVPRVTRPEPARAGPDRSGGASAPPTGFASPFTTAPGFSPGADASPPPVRDADQLAVNNAVAGSVKTAYDVLADTIEQGRKSAEQFRLGAYNVRDVPDDVRHLAGNLLGLARQLSSATFDICEALLRQTGGTMTPPPPGSTPVPPFQEVKPIGGFDGRQPEYPPPPTPQMPKTPAKVAADTMRLSVQIVGAARSAAHTATLARPSVPTAPSHIKCAPLATHGAEAPPVTDVVFTANLADGGLLATVTVPDGQQAGVYAGAVYCTTQSLPLGQLVIELC